MTDLKALSEGDFVNGWTQIVGEPPAVMLPDRREMIELLVEASDIAPTAGAFRPNPTKEEDAAT